MHLLLLILLAVLIAGAARSGRPLFEGVLGRVLPRGLAGGVAGRRSKCSDCVHARKVFEDGTLCGFGRSETFKNAVHVQNCLDHRRR